MGFAARVKQIWQQETQQHVHGWIRGEPAPPAPEGPVEGGHYLQLRCTSVSLRFSRERMADRTPVLQSVVQWPSQGQRISVIQTLDRSRFSLAPGGGQTDFDVLQLTDRALTGDLPLNAGDVEVDIALLAAPTSSLLDRATAFLDQVAELTLVPQLTAAAPVASKLAQGVDALLGNDEVRGVLAFSTSIPADTAKAGHYVITDLPSSEAGLDHLYVKDGALLRFDPQTQQWQPASGFSHIVIEVRVEPPKPDRWRELPAIVDLSQAALTRLSQARTEADVRDAWPPMHQAVIEALYSPDLAYADREPAAAALTAQWKQEAARLGLPPADADKGLRADGPPPPPPPGATPAAAPTEVAAVAAAAARVGDELDHTIRRIVLGEVRVVAHDVEGSVRGVRARRGTDLQAGDVQVDATGVGAGGSVAGIDVE